MWRRFTRGYSAMATELRIRRPDDWHLHVRDGDMLPELVRASAKQMRRAIIMPNLQPPVVNAADARAYRERIMSALPKDSSFEPLMTLYLTDNTTEEDIREAKATGFVYACKLYPKGATTNSASGVTDVEKITGVLKVMAEVGLLLLVHGEVTDPDIDIFDREAVFIERVLKPLRARVPELKIVLEHITTKEAAQYVLNDTSDRLSATITAHHLHFNRNAIFQGGIRPHYYCLPILKAEEHRQALVGALSSPKFFLGTDSAPHVKETKEAACGCAGIFTGLTAVELYTEAFEKAGVLDKLEGFTSLNGPRFYGLEPNEETVKVVKKSQYVPPTVKLTDSKEVVPLMAGQSIPWTMET